MTVHRCIASCFPRRLTQLVQTLLPSDQRVSWQPFAYCFLIPKKEDALAQLQVTDPDRSLVCSFAYNQYMTLLGNFVRTSCRQE